jgi:hypothetical protein
MQHFIGASISISVTAEGSVPRRLHGQWLIAAFRASLNRYHIAWSAWCSASRTALFHSASAEPANVRCQHQRGERDRRNRNAAPIG